MLRRSDRLAKKRRKVQVSRVFGGLAPSTLRPEDPTQSLDDCIEDVELYTVEELYPKGEDEGEDEGEEISVRYVIYQPEVPLAGTEGSCRERPAVLVPQLDPSEEGHPTRDPSALARYVDGEKLVLEDYDYELDPSASRQVGAMVVEDAQYGTQESRTLYNAFSVVPGRPNCYSFGAGYEGKGFGGCRLIDPFSLPEMYDRAESHVNAWVQNTADPLTKNLRNGTHMVSASRIDARRKLALLLNQLREFVDERAFLEKGLGEEHLLIYRGDPMAKVVFLFKSPTFYDMKDARESSRPFFGRTSGSNPLGALQDMLRDKVYAQVREFCHRRDLTSEQEKAVKHMLPILTGDCDPDAQNGGVAALYCVPIHDPEDWGKAKHREANKSVGLGGYRAKSAMSEFPANVLEIFMRYAEVALNIISPAIVVSTSEFTTRCLSVGMNPKRMATRTNVPPRLKWFTVPLTFGGSNLGSMSRRMINPETGDAIELRTRSWCIRGIHPFQLKGSNATGSLSDTAKESMDRVAKKLFTEMRMMEYLTGRDSTLTTFCVNPRRIKEKPKPGTGAPRAMQIRGNYVCKDAPDELTRGYPVDVHIRVVEEGREGTRSIRIDGAAEFPPMVHLKDRIKMVCAHSGLALVHALRTKTVLPVRTSTKSPKQDKDYFTTLPRSPGPVDVSAVRAAVAKKIGPMGKYAKSKANDILVLLDQRSRQSVDRRSREHVDQRSHEHVGRDGGDVFFRRRMVMDSTTSLDHTSSIGSSVDYALYVLCVLEVIDRVVYAEAHRVCGVEGAPSVGKVVGSVSKSMMQHVECTSEPSYEDVVMEWSDHMMTLGNHVKETLVEYVEAAL
jgi:hypothetical protein